MNMNKAAWIAALLFLCLLLPLFAVDDALLNASLEGDTVAVRSLIGAGANVNAQDNLGQTALSLALKNGHEETANALRVAGAS